MASRITDRIKAPWLAIVRHLLPPTIDLFARYPAKVVGQSADWKTVDVQPDTSRLPGMTRLPLDLPPGYRAQVQAGARVLIGWKGGDPRAAFAEPAWEAGAAVLHLELKADKITINPTGAKRSARKGDPVKVTIPSGTFLTAAQGGVMNPNPVDVTGEITDGSSTVEAGD